MKVLAKGDLVVDYATPKDLNQIKAAGYKGVARYICGDPTVWKCVTPRERDQIVAAGLGLWLIWETSATRAFGGPTKGTIDGRLARRDADQLGYNGTIIIAVDSNVSAATLQSVVGYCRAFKAACGLPCGVYGDADVAAVLGGTGEFLPLWQPAAASWSNYTVSPKADIRQFVQSRVPGTDHGEVLKSGVPMWTGTPVAPAQPRVGIPQPTLGVGSRGDEVLHLQQTCNFWGWRDALGRKLAEDGRFGEQTKQGVKSMQKALKRTQDGVYGVKTADAYKAFTLFIAAIAGH